MARMQIRDKATGLTFYEADTPRDALYAYYADKVKGELRPLVVVSEDGVASVTYMGETVEAVPAP